VQVTRVAWCGYHHHHVVGGESPVMHHAGHHPFLAQPAEVRDLILLRQRRALDEAGLDPDAAEERSADVVEHYRQ
jgi:hypothetical protein